VALHKNRRVAARAANRKFLSFSAAEMRLPATLASVSLRRLGQQQFPPEGVMVHCTKCGAAVADNAAFCPACGAPQPAVPPSGVPASPRDTVMSQPQMSENVAGTLCYVLGWVTGLIFFFIDRRPYVRFHAAQSIVVFGGLQVIWFIIATFSGMSFIGGVGGISFSWVLFRLLDLLGFVLWIVLMIKAYQGSRFRVPYAADISERIFGKL
jgi:uncharacterized membrane protein